MRKELQATTAQVHTYIDMLMALIDGKIRHGGSGDEQLTFVRDCMDEIAACNRLLGGNDEIHVEAADIKARR